MDKTDLAKRMKKYEQVSKTQLMNKTPCIIRLDGRAFHTFTKGFQKPFDEILIKTMQHTMKYLCENIQGCVLGYTQSDEITLVLIDYKKLTSNAWFDYEVQKLCSISSSMATMMFNKFFYQNIKEWCDNNNLSCIPYLNEDKNIELKKLYNIYWNAYHKGAMFDSRCFNIPKEEVANMLYWRQLDASKNSIQMLGQSEFSHKELQNKTCNDIQDMLMLEKQINWNNIETTKKRGSCCIKKLTQNPNVDIKDGPYVRSPWTIDNEIPIFKGEGRKYIEDLIYINE